MKKIGFLILFTLIVQGCNSQSSPEKTEHTSIPAVQTGNVQAEETRPDDPNLPNCEPLDLKPLSPEEIIKIDDVVQNCKYEKGFSVYDPFGGGENVASPISIWKNTITENEALNNNTTLLCETKDGQEYSPRAEANKIIPFIEKYKDKLLLSNIYYDLGETTESIKMTYYCNNKICNQLLSPVWGENKSHFFYHGTYDFGEGKRYIALGIDSKLYAPGDFIEHPQSHFLHYQGPRKVSKLSGDNIIVKRYTNGSLLPPYDKNPELIDTPQMFKKAKQKLPIIGTFQIETCEIPL